MGISKNSKWTLLIGAGIALAPIHNLWLTELVTREGEVALFLPAFGTAVWLMSTLAYAFVASDWRKLDLGERQVYIPLLVIVGAIGLSGITGERLSDKVAPLLMGGALFILYLVSRQIGKELFLPLAIGSIVASAGVILHGSINQGEVTGGFVFERNYDVVVGYILLGTMLFISNLQWILVAVSLVAMFLTGSPEAVFACVVMGFTMIARRDWGEKLLYIALPLLYIVLLWFGLGFGQKLYEYTWNVANNKPTVDCIQETRLPENKGAVEVRVIVTREAIIDIKPFGEGYNLTDFSKVPNVHNVPLVIVQQLGWTGILAGLAWLWVSFYCLVRTKWKYAWVLVFALSVFDHYIWTQLAPLWWALVGVSLTSELKSDYIFKGERNEALALQQTKP